MNFLFKKLLTGLSFLLLVSILVLAQPLLNDQFKYAETIEAIPLSCESRGNNIGETCIPKGTKLEVKGIALEFANETVIVPVDKINFLASQDQCNKTDNHTTKGDASKEKVGKTKPVYDKHLKQMPLKNGALMYKTSRNCNFILKKGVTESLDKKYDNFAIYPSIIASSEIRFFLTLRNSVHHKINGFAERIEFLEREKYERVSISFVQAIRNAVPKDQYNGIGGLFDSSVAINVEQKAKLKKIFSKDVVYFILTDTQYHVNEYEMTKEQIFALREMLQKYDELKK